jgi:chemotaxis protein methyltransferase CheR
MPETSSLRWPQFQPFTPTTITIPPPPVATPDLLPTPTIAAKPVPPPDSVLITPPVTTAGQARENSIEYARELLEYGRPGDALKVLQKLESEAPRNAVVLALLGQTLADIGNHSDAEKWCHKALECDKLCFEAYYTLSLVYQHTSRLDQAIEMMKKVVYIERNSILGHYGLANLYHDSGLLSQALKSLDNTLRLLSSQPTDRAIPGSRGITTARLREAVIHQQQTWSQEAG